jgi:hypothetical protein
MDIQPNPEDGTLVQREGVNAGSDRSTVEDTETGTRRVAADGQPIGAPATVVGGGRPPRVLDETSTSLAPETDAVESGQDDGSMS